jgi:hypothetical protein
MALGAVLAFAPAAPAQMALPAVPSVNGRVVGLKFFESGNDWVPRERRVYSSRFEKVSSRFINVELELAYPKPGKVVSFPVACEYLKADSALGKIEFTFEVQADWTGSFNSRGWGWARSGQWTPGTYRVRCASDGAFLSEAAFEIAEGPPVIAAINAKVSALRFFESPKDGVPAEQRKYANRFEAANTRYVGLELEFTHPAAATTYEFPVKCTFYKPDGSSFGTVDLRYVVQPTWKGIVNSTMWGWEAPGNWDKGVYTVSCVTESSWLATDTFEIA